MKHKIYSNKFFKLYYWFLKENDYGISLEYFYSTGANVTLNEEFLDADEDGKEQLDDDLNYLKDCINKDKDWKMNFPAPYYFKDRFHASEWNRPEFEKNYSDDKKSLIDGKKIQLKIDYQNRKNLKNHSTFDPAFKWSGEKYSTASDDQINSEYKILSKIWNSECWRSYESLVKYMTEELGLDLDENEAEFYSPTIELVIK
jgi:hypothetical protein